MPSEAGWLRGLKAMRVSWKGGEVQDENFSATKGITRCDCQEAKSVMAITVKEGSGISFKFA